jgi:hypothetical protein
MGDRVVQSPSELKQQIEAQRAGLTFVVYRDGDDQQRLIALPDTRASLSVGRAPSADISLAWDSEVSRLHAELERAGGDWVVSDDGLSRNGTHVNGERVLGRRRLLDGDRVRFGRTILTFRTPPRTTIAETQVASELIERASISEAQLRVLVALCRPFKDASAYVTPATNQEIAAELFLSVDAVKTHMRALFAKFAVEDLPQNQKRIRLVELALKNGIVTTREL